MQQRRKLRTNRSAAQTRELSQLKHENKAKKDQWTEEVGQLKEEMPRTTAQKDSDMKELAELKELLNKSRPPNAVLLTPKPAKPFPRKRWECGQPPHGQGHVGFPWGGVDWGRAEAIAMGGSKLKEDLVSRERQAKDRLRQSHEPEVKATVYVRKRIGLVELVVILAEIQELDDWVPLEMFRK